MEWNQYTLYSQRYVLSIDVCARGTSLSVRPKGTFIGLIYRSNMRRTPDRSSKARQESFPCPPTCLLRTPTAQRGS